MLSAKQLLRLGAYAMRGTAKDFDPATLPWIDRAGADIEGFVQRFVRAQGLPYDLAEKLRHWQENGYVILERIIPTDWIEQFNAEYLYFLDHNSEFEKDVLVESPDWHENPKQKAKNVPSHILKGRGVKVNDFYHLSVVAKKIMLHPSITAFTEAIFDEQSVGMQSLNFNYGSEQPPHMDFPYVVSRVVSHLAAAWIPLEDVHPDAGPLFYYVGSHRMPKYNWGNGITYDAAKSVRTPIEFSKWLQAQCESRGYEKKTLLIKKGDVLLWHAALVHGGSKINDLSRTRKSYVCHYSSRSSYPRHRADEEKTPKEFNFGNAVCYEHPSLGAEEDTFR